MHFHERPPSTNRARLARIIWPPLPNYQELRARGVGAGCMWRILLVFTCGTPVPRARKFLLVAAVSDISAAPVSRMVNSVKSDHPAQSVGECSCYTGGSSNDKDSLPFPFMLSNDDLPDWCAKHARAIKPGHLANRSATSRQPGF